MSELVTYERDGRIATITMDDGKVNAQSVAMLRALDAALDRADDDGAVVILTGREGVFSAGFDLKVFAGDDPGATRDMVARGARLYGRLLAFPTPVLAACTGHAIAAGSFLLLSCDVRIGAAGPFQMGLNEVGIGLTVPWFALELARQRLHPASFQRVVTAAMCGPQDAVAAGFLDHVVEPGELAAAAREQAEALAALDPPSHLATKLRARGPALRALRVAIERDLAGGDGARVAAA